MSAAHRARRLNPVRAVLLKGLIHARVPVDADDDRGGFARHGGRRQRIPQQMAVVAGGKASEAALRHQDFFFPLAAHFAILEAPYFLRPILAQSARLLPESRQR
jgi:hypothetical protein